MQFLVGGLFGAAGQGIRVIVGLKKVSDQATREQARFGEFFRPSSIAISLLIGFVAGVLGALAVDVAPQEVKKETILTLLGIGYAGTDFIEGFIKKYLPGGGDVGGAAVGGAPDIPAHG
jgi:hypothetical protein